MPISRCLELWEDELQIWRWCIILKPVFKYSEQLLPFLHGDAAFSVLIELRDHVQGIWLRNVCSQVETVEHLKKIQHGLQRNLAISTLEMIECDFQVLLSSLRSVLLLVLLMGLITGEDCSCEQVHEKEEAEEEEEEEENEGCSVRTVSRHHHVRIVCRCDENQKLPHATKKVRKIHLPFLRISWKENNSQPSKKAYESSKQDEDFTYSR
mmetsp:Transcript_74533/g.129241  ORF Transcript_74533/g.129241 Transcript_74533/m.129241 type:complete len:210 (-) Transcript_74533:810-1439(-)